MGHQRCDERRDFKQKLYEAEGAKQYRKATMRIQMGGWMECDFMSLSTVFQSYQDDGWMIMEGYMQWSPV